MNGTLNLPIFGKKHFTVAGGPYLARPANMVGVKMAKEIGAACDIDIPTPDFNVPPKDRLDFGLTQAVAAILAGRQVYVGCYAGRGRTGLFLAILAKTFGIENPVEYVREHYFEHAVETDGQYKFVMAYEPPAEVRRMLRKARLKSLFSFRQCLTNGTFVVN
ncbi:hypothetical protein WK13_34785 [Burkholderia ubonensis]|uniref:protein-tyrosine phosphatase family protein n=1 Tax=Burkholderia ubonensis TaxID=101571 RepID=UPI00075532F1|nr:hypothetical protein [Burkholderia ubonensis]KVR21707.1 hypothetical protein WK13_34785 [Burkholderia ubonensis]